MSRSLPGDSCVPGPPKVPKIMAQYPKIESMGSMGSILLAILEVQIVPCWVGYYNPQ